MSNKENTTESRQARYMLSQHENGSFTLHPVSYSEVPFIGLPKSEELIGAYDTAEERQAALDRIKTSAHAEHAPALEYLRWRLRSENISTGELVHLEGLAEYIDPGDVELLEAAGVPENTDTCGCCGKVLHDDEGGEVHGVGGQISYRCDSCLSMPGDCQHCGTVFDSQLKPDENGTCPHCFMLAEIPENTALCPSCGSDEIEPGRGGMRCGMCEHRWDTESRAGFTPGPWYDKQGSGGQGLIISETDGANIAVTYDEKDARLIAAAPEMFEMAENAALALDATAARLEALGDNKGNTAGGLAYAAARHEARLIRALLAEIRNT